MFVDLILLRDQEDDGKCCSHTTNHTDILKKTHSRQNIPNTEKYHQKFSHKSLSDVNEEKYLNQNKPDAENLVSPYFNRLLNVNRIRGFKMTTQSPPAVKWQ